MMAFHSFIDSHKVCGKTGDCLQRIVIVWKTAAGHPKRSPVPTRRDYADLKPLGGRQGFRSSALFRRLLVALQSLLGCLPRCAS